MKSICLLAVVISFIVPFAMRAEDQPNKPVTYQGPFGSCCKDLKDAMTPPTTSMFRIESNGVLYFSVGYVTTPQGNGWFDQAVIFCPFCGKQLQTREDIKRKSDAKAK
jgi:hypothetical protein